MKNIILTVFIVLLFLSACTGKDKQASAQDEQEMPSETTVAQDGQDVAFDPEEYLLSLPDDPLSDDNVMTVTFDGIVHKELWDTFYLNCEEGKEAEITICNYTIEGDPIYTWLSYDGNTFHAVTDTSRDHFGKAEMHHEEKKYVIVESYVTEEETNGGTKAFQHLQANMTDIEHHQDYDVVYPRDDYYFLWGYSWIDE